ncbi:AbrB/MazE/SpoVT family DNA-binding domain-containing protein (plasmid) [Sutcliffiella horikoshii]|uniref:AbrB/MazE/SpoVT family DNA-binding domain-containing protein n=1 Tax=Sutcliffiella horikoshii TaxID=79883 RepID=UPI001CC020FB|nr:AbrB/MazE/SpoVT family DNA-binding domain-containing protein [Sutcliffiella horikoshii]UAL49807.1 AbrB/MazE/SpoVT family DNA-binding domain-containing protein [Sutcliffiella horikoshii]
MKSTGITRKVDALGRVVIPMELRRVQEIAIGDPLEIFVDNDKIILKKYQAYNECLVSGKVEKTNLSLAGGKIVLSEESARQIIKELQAMLKDPVKV